MERVSLVVRGERLNTGTQPNKPAPARAVGGGTLAPRHGRGIGQEPPGGCKLVEYANCAGNWPAGDQVSGLSYTR